MRHELFATVFQRKPADRGYLRHQLHELLVQRRHDLSAIRPVEFEAVIGFGVVRCGDLHTGGGVQVTHRE